MYSATAYTIRSATPDDAAILERLAALDSQRPIEGPALIGEISGEPAAALALRDARIVADPFRPTAQLATHLRMRGHALAALNHRPALRDRIHAALRPATVAA